MTGILNLTEEIGKDRAEGLIKNRQRQAVPTEREQLDSAQQSFETTPQPKGLGGWLILPIIGLFATIIASAGVMLRDVLPLFESDIWSLYTAPGVHPLWAPLFVFVAFCNVVLFFGAIALLIVLFRKRRIFPKLIIWFYGFSLLALVAPSVVILVFGMDMVPDAGLREEVGWTTSGVVGDLVRGVIPTAIWIPYFLFSKRVKNTFVNTPILAIGVQPGEIRPIEEPRRADELGAVGKAPTTGTVEASGQASSPKPSRHALVWVLSAFLVLVLVAVGVLVWRSTILSNEVEELSAALTSTTTTRSTTTTVPPTTTTVPPTTADPWKGNQLAYQRRVLEFVSQRNALLEKDSKVSGTLAKTHAKAIVEDISALALLLNRFPRSPNVVQDAQDSYFDGLMRLESAASVVRWNDSWTNVDAYNKAWSEEFRLLQVWLREIERAR